MSKEFEYTIDRLEGEIAVLVSDEGGDVTLPRKQLPHGAEEGTVLRVPVAAGGPDWSQARIDRASTEQRLREAEGLLKDLKKRDPGGDVRL